MKVKVTSREQLNAIFSELRGRVCIGSDEDEKAFGMFKKIIRANVEFEDCDAETAAQLAELEELRDQKVIEIAFKRLELVKKLKSMYEESCAEVGKEVDTITKTFEDGEVFSLRRLEHEPDEFKGLSQQMKALKEKIPDVIAKVERARGVLEDESRKSIGVDLQVAESPLKMYFDLK